MAETFVEGFALDDEEQDGLTIEPTTEVLAHRLSQELWEAVREHGQSLDSERWCGYLQRKLVGWVRGNEQDIADLREEVAELKIGQAAARRKLKRGADGANAVWDKLYP